MPRLSVATAKAFLRRFRWYHAIGGSRKYLRYFYNRSRGILNRHPVRNIPVMTLSDTIRTIIDNDLSLVRFGDGEVRMISGGRIGFQDQNKSLADRLRGIATFDDPRILVGVPDTLRDQSKFVWPARVLISNHVAKYADVYVSLFTSKQPYGNAYVTRPYMDYRDKTGAAEHFHAIKGLWRGRRVLIVEGEFTRFGVGNDLLEGAHSVSRILCPSSNAFDFYDSILLAALEHSANTLVIGALGPTAKVLCSDLSRHGRQAVDLGHLDIEYEWFMRGLSSKTAISGKSVNEVPGGRTSEACTVSSYLDSIICTITPGSASPATP